MAITNGYATLLEARRRILDAEWLEASTLAFDSATKTISDTGFGLARFEDGVTIQVTGSALNDGVYVISSGNNPASLVVQGALADEVAGATVTIADVTDVADNDSLERLVEAASRAVDRYCGMHFYQDTGDRDFTPRSANELVVGAVQSVTQVALDTAHNWTYATAIDAGDWRLGPSNRAPDIPAYLVQLTPLAGQRFAEDVVDYVRVSGTWGWASTPAPVKEATLLMADRLHHRGDAPFGVTGAPGVAQMIELRSMDPDFKSLLDPYRALARAWR